MDRMKLDFHPLEATDSRKAHLGTPRETGLQGNEATPSSQRHLRYSSDDANWAAQLESAQEDKYVEEQARKAMYDEKKNAHKHKKRDKLMHQLYANPGIQSDSVHGLMIDAGSTGSRMHLYEWAPRILSVKQDITAAVAGNKLSFPGTESRWTDRLKPGLATFASIADDDVMKQAIAEYLTPLLEFAVTVLHEKQDHWSEYPIFLRATAGMRILSPTDRARVMGAVRSLFHNKTYCPFAFVDEQARVLSGEEEAIFDWTGVNFLLGALMDSSQGAGAVVEPKLTHGALDLGGASTQISFYEPHEDIMSNLFKLQIGQAKHWNLYAHSFLFYGMNEAINRFYAQLVGDKTAEDRLINGIYNPCLARGSKIRVRTAIHVNEGGVETWDTSSDGIYHAILKNEQETSDADLCLEAAKVLLHLEKNDWCNFAHKGDCSLGGTYQPALPMRYPTFGEFIAFSNYYLIWQFLRLPERATIQQLENATRYVCSLSHDELVAFNDGVVEDEDLDSYCFRSAYAFQLLHNGYGFQLDDTIRVLDVIGGQKVGWALGAMLYEINAMPWQYVQKDSTMYQTRVGHYAQAKFMCLGAIVAGMLAALMFVFARQAQRRHGYLEDYQLMLKLAQQKQSYDAL